MSIVLYHLSGPSSKPLPVVVRLPDVPEDGPSDPYIALVTSVTLSNGVTHSDSCMADIARSTANASTGAVADPFADAVLAHPLSADAVHTFTIARLALEMVRLLVCRALRWKSWMWAWEVMRCDQVDGSTGNIAGDYSPLRIIAHADEKLGSSYFRSKRAVLFHVFPVGDRSRSVYSCRSPDVVVHEVGHAILDAIKPDLYVVSQGNANLHAVSAVHEAFADCLWVFFALWHVPWCAEVLDECGGDLRRRCRANHVGSGLDVVDSAPSLPKSASDDGTEDNAVDSFQRDFSKTSVTAYSCGRGTYALSIVFVSFIWDCVVDLFSAAVLVELAGDHGAGRLCAIGRILCRIVVIAMCRCSCRTPTFADWLVGMQNEVVVRDALESLAVPGALDEAAESLHVMKQWNSCETLVTAVLAAIRRAAQFRGIESLGISRQNQRRRMLGNF